MYTQHKNILQTLIIQIVLDVQFSYAQYRKVSSRGATDAIPSEVFFQ